MKVLMLKTELGSDRCAKGCAHPLKRYEAGKHYEIGEELAKAFFSTGSAAIQAAETDIEIGEQGATEPSAPEKKQGARSRKAKDKAPENKSAAE